MKNTVRQIEQREARMKQIESELTEIVVQSVAEETTAEKRAELVVQTQRLAEERITLASEVKELERQLSRREEALAQHREHLMTRL